VLSVAAAVVLIVRAPAGRATVAAVTYGAGLIALFGGSALYHRWPGPAHLKPVLQRIDHSTIFVFIAASYTPIALIVLHGPLVWVLLSIAWTGAATGVAFSLGWIDAPRAVIAGSYLVLGWVAVIAIPHWLASCKRRRSFCSAPAACSTRSARSSTRRSVRTPGRAPSGFTRSSMPS
jgi:hemolysin III